ncbi:unc-45 homolog A [Seminavis robusta]|uniref:Unc-45 homolog A n=1 Tax=Seminavis robusta TaxID=568900 RepID=A0A9N8H392_9STRA|nr:unc-45 homolog A [Seminavis robusta]|eukprot:Sro83_g044160.1 unc-45 homolog A (560) ;mRNA; f:7509-9188
MASGKAGRTDYGKWDKVTADLVAETEDEEKKEIEEQKKALGLDGKYARSAAEAEERKKAQEVLKAKETLERYQNREKQVMTEFKNLLGPPPTDTNNKNGFAEEVKTGEPSIVRISRDMVDAGKRVVTVADTSGNSLSDCIVLTQDLSHLESKMAANAANPNLKPKSYEGDAENEVVEEKQPKHRIIYGLIKAFFSNVHNCTIHIKCKIISGTIELSHCKNVNIQIHKDATVATIQADLCEDITIDFKDAPSSKNTAILPGQPKLYWGDDKDDRIFHAGVKAMRVRVFRDDFMESETVADYLKDGAEQVGNATPEEFQFVTSVVDGKLITEKVIRVGASTGRNVRAMTQREMDEEQVTREKAAAMAIEKAEEMIRFEQKNPNSGNKKKSPNPDAKNIEDDAVEEIYASMTAGEIKLIVDECEQNKTRGNEAFQAGEYGQAILLYSLSLDKSDELPDKATPGAKQLFRRDLVLSNRAACFLKLGQHEKALDDAKRAQEIEPTNIKAIFRRGLSLHAMGRYEEALPILAEAHKMEPKNKQIKQALQFAEVRMTQELRKRQGM